MIATETAEHSEGPVPAVLRRCTPGRVVFGGTLPRWTSRPSLSLPDCGEAMVFFLRGNRVIHYHGTPLSGTRVDASRFLAGRHALVPWKRPENLPIVADVCQSFILDNSAFSFWQAQQPVSDWSGYYEWVSEWMCHPGFDWELIPDVIAGDEFDNDQLIEEWRDAMPAHVGVPVWHFHESLDRLVDLAKTWTRVALGSSGDWPTPNQTKWWTRVAQAMRALHSPEMRGVPFKLHGLRMLNPDVFTRLPLASADSTNVAQNSNLCSRFGQYTPPTAAQRADVIASRIEAHNSMGVWLDKSPDPVLFELTGT